MVRIDGTGRRPPANYPCRLYASSKGARTRDCIHPPPAYIRCPEINRRTGSVERKKIGIIIFGISEARLIPVVIMQKERKRVKIHEMAQEGWQLNEDPKIEGMN